MLPTTSSTTASVVEDGVPGHGLYPIVHEAVGEQGDEVFFMQLTPAERTRLAEDGVPTSIIDRLEAYFESLQRQQDMERGPEGRWALGRVHQRLQDGMEAMDTLFEIVGRRLVPRGFWPIQRLPSSTAVRTSMYQWAGHLRSMVVDLMEAHFQVPLQESELNSINQFLREPVPTGTSDGEPDAASGSRLETSIRTSETEGDFVAATSSSSSSGATGMSRDRSHSPTVRVTRESTCPSPDRGGGIGTPVLDGGQVGVEHNLSSTALSDEALQFWLSSDMRPVLDGELRGVWAEYCPDSTAASSSGDPGPSSSTTSTTTTPDETEDHQPLVLVQKQLDLVYWDDCSTMASPCPSTTTSTPMQPVDLTCWEHGWLNPSSSTSTTTSTRSQSDVIRDAVNQALVHGSQVDVVDFVRRVLDRQRKLRHEDRLLGEALEEAIAWLPHTQQALPLNAAEFDRSVYAHVARLVASGSATGSADPPAPDTSLAVLLQPNFPEDTDAVSTALPGFSPAVGTNTQADRYNVDRSLYLVQTDPTTPIMNWPSDTPRPVPPHVLRENFGLANRRRLRVRRPPPRLHEASDPGAVLRDHRPVPEQALGPGLARRRRGRTRRRRAAGRRRLLPRRDLRRDPDDRDRSRSRDGGPLVERVD